MIRKQISFGSGALQVCGSENDPYIAHLDGVAGDNKFLFYLVERLIGRDSIVLDVGANVGLTASVFASRAKQVIAFEPSPQSFGFLAETIAANRFENVEAHQHALGERNGRLAFDENPVSGAASHLATHSLGGSTATVQVMTLDRFAKSLPKIDFIKIDVEGFELDVLRGGRKTIRKRRPFVFLEFNSFTLIAYGNQNPRAVMEYLLATFPHVYRFEDGAPQEIRTETELLNFIYANLIHRGCVDDLLCSFVRLEPPPHNLR